MDLVPFLLAVSLQIEPVYINCARTESSLYSKGTCFEIEKSAKLHRFSFYFSGVFALEFHLEMLLFHRNKKRESFANRPSALSIEISAGSIECDYMASTTAITYDNHHLESLED